MPAPNAGMNPVGGVTIPSLLNRDDYATFESLDTDWFLAAAGQVIRNFVGWHVSPSVTETLKVDVCGDGRIFLPTMYLTDVTSVTPPWPDAPELTGFHFDQHGWITLRSYSSGFGPSSGDMWPVDSVRLFDPYPKHNRRVIVEFSHGYAALPYPVAEVASELVMRCLEKPAGIATSTTIGPYAYKFQEMGLVLSDDQKNRLSYYKIPGVS